jgi:hypothetical protein
MMYDSGFGVANPGKDFFRDPVFQGRGDDFSGRSEGGVGWPANIRGQRAVASGGNRTSGAGFGHFESAKLPDFC